MNETYSWDELKNEIARLAREKSELALMLKAAQIIPLSTTFHESARKIYEICKSLIGTTCGYVALLKDDGTENEVLFLDDGGLPCDVDPNLPMPVRGLRSIAYRKNMVACHNAFHTSKYMHFMPDGHLRLDNVLFAPLVFGSKTVGVIGMANKPGGFTEHDEVIAKSFGNIAALALKHAMTYEALQERETFSRNLLAESPNPILVINPDKTIRFVNPAFENLTGFTSNEIIGTSTPYPWWTEDTLQKTRADFNKAMVSGAVGVEEEFCKKTGVRFFVEITSRPVMKNGVLSYYLANWLDITEHKEAEKILHEKSERLRLALETAELGYWRWNISTNEVLWFGDHNSLFGIKKTEFRKTLDHVQEFVHPNDRENGIANLRRTLEEDVPFDNTYRVIHPDGSIHWLNSFGRLSKNAKGLPDYIFGITRDITVYKLTESKLKDQAHKLEELNTALKVLLDRRESEKNQISENILQNVKKTILPYIEKIENLNLDTETSVYVDIIKSNLNDLLSPLVNQLSSGAVGLTPKEIQITDLIKNGKTSKEIATLLNVSLNAILVHRYNIRKKLGLLNKKINLVTFLQSFPIN